jgi:hypothetical protein
MRHIKLLLTLVMATAAFTAIAATAAHAEEGFLPWQNVTFKGEGGQSTLETLGKLRITCVAHKMLEGTFTSDSHGKIGSIHYTGCKAEGVFPALSLGDLKEVILIPNVLFLVCLKEGVYYLFLELGTPVHVEVPLATDLLTFAGSIIGEILMRARTAHFEVHFKQKAAGDPEPTECTGADGIVKKAELKVELDPKTHDHASIVALLLILTSVETELMEK